MMQLKLKQVTKAYEPKKACVYAITHPGYLDDHFSFMLATMNPAREVYIGVTEGKIAQRWRDHKALRARDNQTTSRFIKKFGYEFEDCFRVIFEGTPDQCYRLEFHLRPLPKFGLNTKTGGKLHHRVWNDRYINMIEKAWDADLRF